MLLAKHFSLFDCLALFVSPFCTPPLITSRLQVGAEGRGGSDWNSLWSNDCKLWTPRGFSNHSWMGWRVNVGRLWSGGESRSENSIDSVALSRALHAALMVELFWHWMDTWDVVFHGHDSLRALQKKIFIHDFLSQSKVVAWGIGTCSHSMV